LHDSALKVLISQYVRTLFLPAALYIYSSQQTI